MEVENGRTIPQYFFSNQGKYSIKNPLSNLKLMAHQQ